MPVINNGPGVQAAGGFAFRNAPMLGMNVINKTGSTIAAGKLVAITGFDVTSMKPKIVLADADLAAHYDLWVTFESIADGRVSVVYKGYLSAPNIDTSGATTVGDPIYLSGTAGAFAHTPDSTKAVIPVGFVMVKSATVGQIFWALPLGISSGVDNQVAVHAQIAAGAAAADFDAPFFIADRAYIVTAVRERHQTAGTDASAVTLMVKKVPSGTAKASGTDVLSAGINMKATADTVQSGSLHGTAANYTLAAGDSLALVTTGVLTSLDGVGVTVILKKI